MQCLRCKNELSGKQEKYCSERCSKLYLKAQYKKRNKEKIGNYRRLYQLRIKEVGDVPRQLREYHLQVQPCCLRCGSNKDVQICHVKPRHLGGMHMHNIITLCRTHHHQFDEILRIFWGDIKAKPVIKEARQVMMLTEIIK